VASVERGASPVVIFTIRDGLYRIIGVRRAHDKEIRKWAGSL